MRGARGFAAAVVGAALVFGLSACSSPPEITDAQVAAWQQLAEQTIPAATAVTISADHNVTMFGGGSNLVHIDTTFANFADLKASEQAILGLRHTVGTEAPGTSVDTAAVNSGADSHEAELSARLVHDVPALTSANVVESTYYFYSDQLSGMSMGGNLWLYVADDSVLDPAWLDQVANVAQAGFAEVDGHLFSIRILPADAVNLKLSDPALRASLIHLSALKAFTDYGVSKGCVRTDSWAYDVSDDHVIAYPADEPGGACS